MTTHTCTGCRRRFANVFAPAPAPDLCPDCTQHVEHGPDCEAAMDAAADRVAAAAGGLTDERWCLVKDVVRLLVADVLELAGGAD